MGGTWAQYAWVPITLFAALTHWVLHEHISWAQRLGLTLILAGVLKPVLA